MTTKKAIENGFMQHAKRRLDWSSFRDHAVFPEMLPGLSARARNVLFLRMGVKTVGDLLDVQPAALSGVKGAGRKTTEEILRTRDRLLDTDPRKWIDSATALLSVSADEPSASSFGSLSEMMTAELGRVWKADEQKVFVMNHCMGLLNAQEAHTLVETAAWLGVSHERVRHIVKRISSALFSNPPPPAIQEVLSTVRKMFKAARDRILTEQEVERGLDSTFGWTGTTCFSVLRLLGGFGIPVVALPDGRGCGWNEDGRFDKAKRKSSNTEIGLRKKALQNVVACAGISGISMEGILAECRRRFPERGISEVHVRGLIGTGADLDGMGSRVIGFSRGSKGKSAAGEKVRTLYVLNTMFHDEATLDVLRRAGDDVRAYMEHTGLTVVSVCRIWQRYLHAMPVQLPKLGCYMMMRDLKAGGLDYHDYPRIAYPGFRDRKNAFWRALCGYCRLCGRTTATHNEIMTFLCDALGLERNIARSSVFHSMGLEKTTSGKTTCYEIKCPPTPAPPKVFLPAISGFSDFSLTDAEALKKTKAKIFGDSPSTSFA